MSIKNFGSVPSLLQEWGYMKEYRVEKYLRDAKLYEIGGGTNEVRKLIIAREILKSF
ncbi:MAG: hypothetical protein HY882_00920 [Deltaproteobacteria bacterium]|nr:hypothetical protein [Deltaproteobacteria bacterium]